MLDSLRHLTTTWYGKVLGVLLLIGLAGFGISNVITQFGANTIATVAGEEITVRDYQRAYDNQVNLVARQIGRVPTQDEALALGVPGMVFDRLSGEAAVNKLANEMGLGVSDEKLKSIAQQDPNFQNALGVYDRETAIRVLQQYGYTEAQYSELQTRTATRQQLVSGLLGGVPVSKTAVELLNRYAGDTRTVDYFVLNAQALPPVAEPTEEELAAYLKDHQADFRTKATRTVDLLAFSPEALAKTKTVSDADVAAEYEATKANRVKIEKRTIEQLALSTPELEKAFTDGKAAGTPLADLLKATGATPQSLGTLAKSEVTDPTLAETAFGLGLNDYAIIEGIGSKRVITVSAIEAGGQISLEDSKEEIRQKLALTQARAAYGDILDQIEELRAAFKPLKEIADRFGLQVVSIPLTEGGPELSSNPDISPEDAGKIASTIFNAKQGELAPTITLSSNRNVFFDIVKIEDARDQTLDEVRAAVAAAWTSAKTGEALTAEVNKILDQLKAGTAFADAAVGIGQFPILSQPLKRSGDGTSVINQTVANEIFNGGPDHFGTAVNGDGDHVVFHVVEVTPAAGDATPQIDKFVEDSTREGIYGDFMAALKAEAGLRINQKVMSQVLGTGTQQ